ncbi:cation diffusion facilitator family transporter [Schnuerera sp. xch1]|uniref:cation diffusion facilitator family transporter n=1 Tax=Schnuerera sp. xch1 TaxID=2874283 RepID=UPI001CBCDA5F|nr:cation diffusion facilitator family transporter [Schnuerera sp. xch1]MBZ2174619.1 cation diffusion facilitator family transporter [Schnuerera sp. xch1]
MINFIIKRFIKDHENINDKYVRESYGILSGVLGIICNLFLFILKLAIGLFMNSIAVISDAFNNLSDLGSSVVIIFGAKLSNQPPDDKHPHGHGRYEYIASLVVAFIIFAVGLETLRESFNKIINPETVVFSQMLIVGLLISILVKLWMFSYNKYISKRINSGINRATAYDSLNDAAATFIVIVGTLIGKRVNLPIDGLLGLIISALIMYTGFDIAKDSVNLLLGSSPDPQLIDRINELILENENIIGVHDLIVHDYGPKKMMASIHVEVSDDENIVDIHSEIDKVEQKVEEQLDIDIVIHMDPVEDKK